MTDRLEDVVLTRPTRGRARPARRAPLRPRRGALPAAHPRQPARRDVPRHPHRGPPARRRHARRACSRELADEKAHLAAIEALDAGRPVAGRPARARPRDPQRRAGRSSTPRSSGPGSAARRRSTRSATPCSSLFARDFAPLPERLDAIASRLEAVPAFLEESQDPGDACPRSGCGSSSRSSRRRDLPVVPRRDRRRRRRPARTPSDAASTPAADTRASGDRGLRRLARGDARRRRPTTGRSGASATTSSSRCGRSTASTPTRSSRSARSSSS